MEDRRRVVRRQGDRQLLARYEHLVETSKDDDARQLRHMRRHAIRHNCTVDIALRIASTSGRGDTWTPSEHRIKGRILDLSAEGCSLFTREDLAIGQRLSVVIHLENAGDIRAQGAVRWSKSVPEKHGYASGVQFERLGEGDVEAIQRFLQVLDRTIGL